MKLNRGEVLGLMLILAAVLISVVLYPRLPETLPSHWNLRGRERSGAYS